MSKTIEVGKILRLHEGSLYRIDKFYFVISEESGNWVARVDLTEVNEKGEVIDKTNSYPIWMIEELLQRSQMYPREKDNCPLLKKYHAIKKKEKEIEKMSQTFPAV